MSRRRSCLPESARRMEPQNEMCTAAGWRRLRWSILSWKQPGGRFLSICSAFNQLNTLYKVTKNLFMFCRGFIVRGYAAVLVPPLARPQRCPAVTRHRPRLHGSGDLPRLEDTRATPDSTRFVFCCFWCASDFSIVYRGGRGLRACGVAAPAWLPTVCLRRLA